MPETDGKRGRFSEPETLAVKLRRFGRLEIDLLQSFGADLLKALSYVHECGLAHRDVMPDNIGLRLPRPKERVWITIPSEAVWLNRKNTVHPTKNS